MVHVTVDGQRWTIELEDNGTLDTVVRITDEDGEDRVMTYSQEFAANYRDENGWLDLEVFADEVVSNDIDDI